MSEEERYCLEALHILRLSYERDAKPYIDRLVAIKSMQPAPSIVFQLTAIDPALLAEMAKKSPTDVPRETP